MTDAAAGEEGTVLDLNAFVYDVMVGVSVSRDSGAGRWVAIHCCHRSSSSSSSLDYNRGLSVTDAGVPYIAIISSMAARHTLLRVTRSAQRYRAFHTTALACESPIQQQPDVKHEPRELTGSAKLLAEALEEEAAEAENPSRRRRTVADRAVDDSP